MLHSSLIAAGNKVDVWAPTAKLYTIFSKVSFAKKWAGYVDQYLIFPLQVRRRLKMVPPETLLVFCDQALGPWMPMVKQRPHVVHVHDLLALRSALGHFPENPTSFTGRVYQRYIRRGFKNAKHFISVSENTKRDLHRYGQVNPDTSEVVYNGLNFPFKAMSIFDATICLVAANLPASHDGILLHVGGNQWYKNLAGVIAIYAEYSHREKRPLPLVCVAPEPSIGAQSMLRNVRSNGKVFFVQKIDNLSLQAAYSLARALLFPSLAEGFGWPLIEAQACGCPVITTDEPPMNEVAGAAAIYLPRLKFAEDIQAWAVHGASQLMNLLAEPTIDRLKRRECGIARAAMFDSNKAIARYIAIYERIATECGAANSRPG